MSRAGAWWTTPDYRAVQAGPGVKGIWIPAAPHLIVGQVRDCAALSGLESIPIPGYWFDKQGTDVPVGTRAKDGEKIIYALHGGGYVAHSAHPDDGTSNIPRGMLEHTSPSVTRSLAVEYRLTKPPSITPSNPFPAALIDAIAGYNYLVHDLGFAPENIIVEGDSAGGNLALALARYLVENQGRDDAPIPPPPGGLILLSPWVDLSPAPKDPTSSMHANQRSDFINMATATTPVTNGWIFAPLGQSAGLSNRYISPASVSPSMEPISFEGFPRTIIFCGGAEVLRDQIHVLHKRMEADLGADVVKFVEMPDGIHDFTVFPWHEPERTESFRTMGEWIDAD